jgi:hypothetical protein
MTENVRPDVVAELLVILSDGSQSEEEILKRVASLDATGHEKMAAANAFSAACVNSLEQAGTLRKAPSLLDLTFREVQAVVRRGIALAYMLDRWGLPYWASRPDTPLIDVLKTMPPSQIEDVAKVLRAVGITDLDQGDT